MGIKYKVIVHNKKKIKKKGLIVLEDYTLFSVVCKKKIA